MVKRKTRATTGTRGRGRPPKAKDGPSVPKKKLKLEPINFVSHEIDPIIENLKKFCWDRGTNFDIGSEILDQTALEGLSGITFKRLLHMLDAVSPKLNCVKDGDAQEYIWTLMIKLLGRQPGSGVKAYYSPNTQNTDTQVATKTKNLSQASSSSQEIRSPSKCFLLDKEIKLPKETIARISKRDCSLFALHDGAIMGSCKSYLTRQDITDDLKLISTQAQSSLEALHVVNNKFSLDNVFFVADQEVRRKALLPDWSDPNVDIKMREYACLELIGRTRALGVVFPNDKALGRYRILLTNKNFISQYQPRCTSHIVHHIIRFSKYVIDAPDDGKIYRGPAASSTFTRVQEFDVEDEFEDDDDDGGERQTVTKICCNPRRLRIANDMLKMVYQIIAFSRGRSPLDIRRKLKLPKFHVRNHLKNLANIELIGSHTKRIDDQTFRIYRARHKSLVYIRRLREKQQKLKLKASGKGKFDEIDLRAKSVLGARRSQFSQAEDSLLIVCRICCLLLEPTLTKKVSFCVNKRFIRDLLHDELCESHDKTADACLRRIKYLRKLPNNIMSINELTAELRDDPDITRFTQQRESAKTEDKLNKLFTQTLKVVRAKLPHLLGLSSIGASSHLIAQKQSIEISSYSDLMSKYELIDCQATSSSRYRPNPGATILQLTEPVKQEYQLDLSECNEMPSIALLSSFCTHNAFNVELMLKVPPVIVGLDQGNESYKQLCAKAKDRTKELLTNLSSANPSADSRRALFMLRNELKSQALDKFGNLADALIVQPCNVRFSSKEATIFHPRQLLDNFLMTSNFCSSIKKSSKSSAQGLETEKKPTEPNGGLASLRRSTRANRDPKSTRNRPSDDQCDGRNGQQSDPQEASSSGMKSLMKALEIILSWIFVMPGIEFESLYLNVKHLFQSKENLTELIGFMKQLELISEHRLESSMANLDPCGIVRIPRKDAPMLTYEPQSNAYIKFGQLLSMARLSFS